MGLRGSCVLLVVVTLALHLLPWSNTFRSSIFLLYIQLRYWLEGQPLSSARNDALYFMVSAGVPTEDMFPGAAAAHQENRRRILRPVLPNDDHITAVCKVSMYTEMISGDRDPQCYNLGENSWGIHNMDTQDPVTTEDRVDKYIGACKEIYDSLDKDGEQRRILDRMTPTIKFNVTTPADILSDPMSIERLRQERARIADGRPDLSSRWKAAEDLGPHASKYISSGFRPVRE